MDVEVVIGQNLGADLLRLVTAGSVDDGKSTLIGRLLYDANGIYEDQIKALRRRGGADEADLALVTDGLRAEREQGITIDVAYRYFTTPRRRFIVADVPGHEQYTRNMVTGASNADVAVILVDARSGVVTQTKRHGFIASLLAINHIVVVVNKMDLAGYSREPFEQVRRDFADFAAKLGVRDLSYIPVSALRGDNVVSKSRRMRWYDGPGLLTHLETLYIAGGTNLIDLRFPVQLVTRADSGFRGYAGQVASGVVRTGDEVLALPSGRPARVKRIMTAGGETDYAFAPQAATLCLEDEIDVGRGDMLVHPANLPRLTQEVEAIVVWMDDRPLEIGREYIVKHTTNAVKAEFASVNYRIDPDKLHRRPAAGLALNEVGRVLMRLRRPIMCDEYNRNRRTGGFIIIDPDSNNTAGAGMIIERSRHKGAQPRQPARAQRRPGGAPDEKRKALLRQEPVTLWLTGLSGSGKSTIARAVEDRLVREGHLAYVLDGDRVRLGLNSDLGFSPDDRRENIRRAAQVARLFNDAGLIMIASFISPYAADRAAARGTIGEERFVEVFVDAPTETCESRDAKGLYKKARSGEIPDFTGVSAPYEAPDAPEVHLHTDTAGVEECVEEIMRFVRSKGFLGD